ncbi:DsrE family protein [Clostridium sp.]|uniref:DsrE family protein n=1 Tax=Clostridium sp. TaxID=1506 RepID=UPI0032173BB2
MKILFHIDELNKWDITIGNIKNVIKFSKENKEEAKIEVVANGEAVFRFKENENANSQYFPEFEYLDKEGVKVVACNNALSKFYISKEEIFSFIEVVSAGVVEIVKKQEEGYAYIKP